MTLTLYRPSLRAWGAIAVLAAWVGSLGWLGAREFGRSERATMTSEASLRLSPGAAWFAVLAGDVPVGNAGITLDTLSPGYRILQTVSLELPGDTGVSRATRRTETRLAGTLELVDLHSRYTRGGREYDWQMTMVGDSLGTRYAAAAGSTHGVAALDEPGAPMSAFPYRLALSGGLNEGNSRDAMLVDGWPPAAAGVTARVGAERAIPFADSSVPGPTGARWVPVRFDTMRAYPVVLDGVAGPERIWIDRRGTVARVETVFGVTWRRGDFDLVVADFRRHLAENTDAIRAALPVLVPYATLAAPDSSIRERHFRVTRRDGSPIDRELLALLAGGRQAVHGDTVLVRSAIFATQPGRLQDAPRDPMIQQDALPIVTLARKLRAAPAGRTSVPDFLRQLHQMIRVDTSADAPADALGTLRARRGTPDGIARLFVAAMRAARLPARYVIGVDAAGDTLHSHAWAETWDLGAEGWVAVDPALGRPVAATSLIRVATAGSSRPEEMLDLLADVRFTDLDRMELQP